MIDADGHWLEYGPVFSEQMRKIGGNKAADAFLANGKGTKEVQKSTVEERKRRRLGQEGFWSRAERNTRDRATGMFPRFLYERLEELGIDFAAIYPTAGLRVPRIGDDEARRAVCRAFNIVTADYFRDFGDRMTPAAVIPTHTPDEAIEELEFCVRQLGTKVVMFTSPVPRPVSSITDRDGDVARFAVWHDAIGLDSDYDYDPLWTKCVELGIAPTFHTGASRQGLRLSATNFTFNHIGHFAASGHAACKAIFLGGITRRFPQLRFAFLEGGVGWGCMLFGDLIGHWDKRNRKALERTDPRTLDRALLQELAEKYGYPDHIAALRARDGWPDPEAFSLTGGLADLDDFSRCKITKKEDWRDLFVTPFYFGCEADDRANAWAFEKGANPFNARLNAIFGSDIGHFDVPDMMEVLPEAYELVDDGMITRDDFRDFTFANAVRLWGTQNPTFFEGTAVATAAAAVLAEAKTPAAV
ncbi:MAG: amidohydrolase family protein [Candidatus Rokubacteria bacterium]|nr:amidohydrolase family protein [Candidatus Rokubacteria bacterium]